MSSWARICSCVAALSFLHSTACRAGAFLQKPGEGIVILSTSFADAHKAYDSRGKLVTAPSYDKFETQAYVEYGLIDEITFVAESSYMRFRGANEQRQLEQLQYLTAEAIAGAPLYLRSLLYFFYRYILRFGFLDGREGLLFHVLHGLWYFLLIDAKVDEARGYISENGVDAFRDHLRRRHRIAL